jgi:hypothetical protein
MWWFSTLIVMPIVLAVTCCKRWRSSVNKERRAEVAYYECDRVEVSSGRACDFYFNHDHLNTHSPSPGLYFILLFHYLTQGTSQPSIFLQCNCILCIFGARYFSHFRTP